MIVSEAVLVAPPALPVTVCAPAAVALQELPLQEPLGPIEKVVLEVTSPIGLSEASCPCAVYFCEAPAVIVAAEGLTTMWSMSALGVCCGDAPALAPLVLAIAGCPA